MPSREEQQEELQRREQSDCALTCGGAHAVLISCNVFSSPNVLMHAGFACHHGYAVCPAVLCPLLRQASCYPWMCM